MSKNIENLDSDKEFVANYQTYPSEYEDRGTQQERIAEKHLGFMGRMVGGSKSIYSYDHPSNLVVFNANICVPVEKGSIQGIKIWHGDLDITKDYKKLQKLSKELKKPVYVLYEMDARFEHGNNPKMEKSVIVFAQDGSIVLTNNQYEMKYLKNGVPHTLTDEEYEAKNPTPPREKYIYNRKEYPESIDLPDLKTFKITKKSDPLSDFQKYFIEKYGKEKAQELYREMWVTEEYNKDLENLVTKYAKKKYPDMHPAKVEQSVMWAMLDASPSHFIDTPDWAEQTKGYIRKRDNQ